MSALVAARDGADRLTEDELTSMVFLLLVAGHETTVNLIGNGMHTLLTHPDRRALLQRRAGTPPGHDRGAAALRRPGAGGDVPLDERARADRRHRDPGGRDRHPRPARRQPGPGPHRRRPTVFDPTRDATAPHLAFGHGVHHCLGASLARLEGRIALGSLLARLPDLRLAVPVADLRWRPSVLMHGLAALPCSRRARREPGAPLSPWRMA